MSRNRIDIHCHLFSKHTLSRKILSLLIKQLTQVSLRKIDIKKSGAKNFYQNIDVFEAEFDKIAKINNFLKIANSSNSELIYKKLQKVEKNYIIAPLTLDLDFCFYKELSSEQKKKNDEKLLTEFKSLKLTLDTNIKNVTLDLKKLFTLHIRHKNISIEENTTSKIKKFKTTKREFDKLTDKLGEEKLSFIENDYKYDASFHSQIEQIKQLKQNDKYSDKVFPFLSVDPRRKNILQFVKQNVGKNKIFYGVKIYTPTGYSPTDPVLFGTENDNDCVYKFCEENGIPITAHCSDAGFATFANKLNITGVIYRYKEIIRVDDFQLYFKYSVVKDGLKAVQERGEILNHPLLWEQVLQKFPNLYLNLAHFGGKNDEWRQHIIDLMSKYKNLYADLSGLYSKDLLIKIRNNFYKKLPDNIKNKIMYGSDYYIVTIFESDFEKYLNNFEKVFSNADFDKLTIDNPSKFLFER
ncbi:MAG: amidohydrolase family protein [Bacteroidetes bacterium]|nr:amidohydrolase family protein [Bacteroidota bacterium]